MGDFPNYYSNSYAPQKTFGHVPYYNSLNLWMNKPSMTSSSPSSVIVTPPYVPRQTMSDVGTFGGVYRMGGTSTLVLPPENVSSSVAGGTEYQRSLFAAKQANNTSPAFFQAHITNEKSRDFERHTRWQQQRVTDPVVNNRQYVSFPTKPVAVFQAPPTQVNSSQTPQEIYKYRGGDDRLIFSDDSKYLSPSSKEYSLSTTVTQKSSAEKSVPGRTTNVYVAEPHRNLSPLRENERSDFPPARPLFSPPFPKTSAEEKSGALPTPAGANVQRLKEGAIIGGRREEEILDEIDELYGKIKPTNKLKVQGQVNAESRSGEGQSKNQQDPIAWKASPKPPNAVQSQFASTSPPSSSAQVPSRRDDPVAPSRPEFPSSKTHLPPRSDVSAPPSQPPPKREEARPSRSQLPRTDIGRVTAVASPQPPQSGPVDPGPARSQLPRTNFGRNQPTVGHRMLRDVLRGRNGLNQSTATPPIDERNVVNDAFRFLDDFDD